MSTLEEYRRQCGWSLTKLAREAEVDINTVRNALAGRSISATTAGKLADAISEKLGRRIPADSIEELNVNW